MWNAHIFLQRIQYGSKRKISDESSSGGTSTERDTIQGHANASTEKNYIIKATTAGVPDIIYKFYENHLDMLMNNFNLEHYKDFKNFGKWFYKPKEQKIDEKDYGIPKLCADNSLRTSREKGVRIAVGVMFIVDIPFPIDHIVNLVTEDSSVSVLDTSPGSKDKDVWYFLVETSPKLLNYIRDIPSNRANPPEMLLDAWRFFDEDVRREILKKNKLKSPFWEIGGNS